MQPVLLQTGPTTSVTPQPTTGAHPSVVASADTAAPAASDSVAALVAESGKVPAQLPAIEVSKDPTIPLYDFEKIKAATGFERSELIEQLGKAFRLGGFIGLKISAEHQHIVDAVNVEMKRYFGQDLDVKMRDWRDNNGQTGYSERGRETAAGAKAADMKEMWMIPPNHADWPEGQASFEESVTAYHKKMTEVAGEVLAMLLEYLDQPTDAIRGEVASANGNLARLIHYFAPSEGDHPEAVWAGAHKDLNAVTLLPRPSAPGLQMLTKEGKWRNVVVPEGYLVVNFGEQIEQLTGGMIKATPHQVVNPGGEWARQERFASVFFASFPDDKKLTPIEGCLDLRYNEEGIERETIFEQYPLGITTADGRLSRLIEMGVIKEPGAELVAELRKKGLLRQPPEALVKLYPSSF
jgi:isopenicillin N synthase-like dioxygenase